MNTNITDAPRLSVAIITLNEEDRLPRCLESLSFADEIVVIDSGSRDNTVEIAKSFGCKVIYNEWPGYAKQKQYAVDNCKYDWVFILDADERVPPETGESIKALIAKSGKEYTAFGLDRKAFFHDRWMRRCGWWPDRVVRIVNRRQGKFSDHLVHEQWVTEGAVEYSALGIEHYSFRNYGEMFGKVRIYAALAARDMYQNNKTAGWWTPILRGSWMFFRAYFLEQGIMAGFDGFFISLMTGLVSFLKYAELWEMRRFGVRY